MASSLFCAKYGGCSGGFGGDYSRLGGGSGGLGDDYSRSGGSSDRLGETVQFSLGIGSAYTH